MTCANPSLGLKDERRLQARRLIALTLVIQSAETAAWRTIQEHAVLILSAREREMFIDAILSPSEPGPVLRAAARHYKRKMGK